MNDSTPAPTETSPDDPDLAMARAFPLEWRKRRFPLWVRFGLAGVKGRSVMLVHLWSMAVLTALSLLAFVLSHTSPKLLPWGFRDPAWSGTMVVIGCVGLVHLRAVLRWLDERDGW